MNSRLSPAVPLAVFLAACLVTCLSVPAIAQDDRPDSPQSSEARASEPRLGLGLGFLATAEPYRQLDDEVNAVVIPVIDYESRRFFISGPRAGVHLWTSGPWRLDAGLSWRFTGFDEDDGPFFDGMEDREDTIDADLSLLYRLPKVQFELRVAHDVLDRHEDLVYRAEARFPRRNGRWTWIPLVGLEHQSDGFVSFYYGVRPDEARPGRPAYRGDTATHLRLGLDLQRRIGRMWSLYGAVRLEELDDPVTESPLVDDDRRVSALFGVIRSIPLG